MSRVIAGGELRLAGSPLWLLVGAAIRDVAQETDDAAGNPANTRPHERAGRRIHERHELIREAWHGATDADAPDVRATTDAVHPSPLGHVAIHDRPPAA